MSDSETWPQTNQVSVQGFDVAITISKGWGPREYTASISVYDPDKDQTDQKEKDLPTDTPTDEAWLDDMVNKMGGMIVGLGGEGLSNADRRALKGIIRKIAPYYTTVRLKRSPSESGWSS